MAKQNDKAGDKLEAHPKHAGYYHVEMISKLLNVSKRRIQQLAAEGSIPKGIDGYYPLMETVNRYCKYLQERSRGRPASEKSEESTALVIERRRKLKLENDFRAGHLVEFEKVAQLFVESIVLLGNMLDGAAGRISGGDAVLRQRLLVELRRIRETFSEGLASFAARYEGGEPSETSAAESTVAMGGSKKGTS